MVLAKRVLVLFMLCFASIPSTPSGASDLTEALKLRDVAKVRSLLAAGADADEKVRRDYPLNIAATYGPAEMVTILLEAGANIEQPGRDGFHPLHNAVISGRKEIVVLLQRGAVVDARENKGRTPLVSFAATGGSDIEIARMLLAAGADPGIESASDDDSSAALDYAAGTANLELGELLIEAHVDVNHRDLAGSSALHISVHSDHLEIVRLLIAHGADVNLKTKAGLTPLFYAPNDAMRQLLIAAGAK